MVLHTDRAQRGMPRLPTKVWRGTSDFAFNSSAMMYAVRPIREPPDPEGMPSTFLGSMV